MKAYTVIGYYPDTDQTYWDFVNANSASEARADAIEDNNGPLVVIAVIAGEIHDAEMNEAREGT